MPATVLFSVVESPTHPNLTATYRRLGIEEQRFSSIRKAIHALRKSKPDYLVAEFFFGYGNNYAGANLGNLDVLLSSLQKYAPQARVIVMVQKSEREYAARLAERFAVYALLEQPVEATQVAALLRPD